MLCNTPPHADMFKAFDRVDRAILLKKLKTILDPEELHLIKIRLNTELTLRKYRCLERRWLKCKVRALYKENNYHICKKSTITISSEVSSV